MNRRNFTKSILAASAMIAMDNMDKIIIKNEVQKNKLPDNWIWIRPDLSWTDDQWKENFDTIKSCGIDAVLPQVYNSNFTLFDHPILPVKERWLERIIPIAHGSGLEVHAWMWSMPLNVPQMIEKHPDWFSVSRKDQPSHTHPAYVDYYKFMCPCHPEVQEFVAGNVAALAKIEDLDGIHLDYIRQPDVILAEALQPKYNLVQDKEYPEFDYPYSERCRNQFKEKTGIDPLELGDDAPHNRAWRQFRYDAITNIVNNHAVPEARKRNKKITAAVFPNWESVRQQWQVWDLDGFLPMLYHGFYNESIDWIGQKVKENRSLVPKEKNIYAGLYLPDLTPEELPKAYETARSNGATGISIFAYGGFDKQFQTSLKNILK